jgi:hypothetical protein
MPANPALSPRRCSGTDWRRVAADGAIMAAGWSLLCLVLHHPEVMLALVTMPLGWRALSYVRSEAIRLKRHVC